MSSHAPDITRILTEARGGDEASADRLWKLLYGELRRIAHRELHRQRKDHTLTTTALVHEAYLKLVGYQHTGWQDRRHFLALSCQAMRQVLIDYARRHRAQKRVGQRYQVSLEKALTMAEMPGEELLALDEALTQLSSRDRRLGQVVECRYFGGLSVEETAEVIGISRRTAERDWGRAKAYLYEALCMETS